MSALPFACSPGAIRKLILPGLPGVAAFEGWAVKHHGPLAFAAIQYVCLSHVVVLSTLRCWLTKDPQNHGPHTPYWDLSGTGRIFEGAWAPLGTPSERGSCSNRSCYARRCHRHLEGHGRASFHPQLR